MNISLARPLVRGVGHVSQRFGENPKMYAAHGYAGHNGMDYGVPVGHNVRAPIGGIVTEVHDDGAIGYGLHVVIKDGKCGVLLAHLSRTFVEVGQTVPIAEAIGLSGNTGHSTGPHVHFGFWIEEMWNQAYKGWIDPWPFRDLEI